MSIIPNSHQHFFSMAFYFLEERIGGRGGKTGSYGSLGNVWDYVASLRPAQLVLDFMWRAVGCSSLVHSPLFLAMIIWGKEERREKAGYFEVWAPDSYNQGSNNQDFKSSYPGPFQVRQKRVTLTVGKEADTHTDFTSCLQDLNSLKGAKQLV